MAPNKHRDPQNICGGYIIFTALTLPSQKLKERFTSLRRHD